MANESHNQEAMHRVMQCCRDFKDQGLTLQPNGVWDGSRDDKFIISGRSDSDYATDPAHALLGHSHEDATRATAGYLGWKLTRGSAPCQSCAESKAKQKNVPKESKGEKAMEPNGRVFQDLATVKMPEKSGICVGRPNWQMIVLGASRNEKCNHRANLSQVQEDGRLSGKASEDSTPR